MFVFFLVVGALAAGGTAEEAQRSGVDANVETTVTVGVDANADTTAEHVALADTTAENLALAANGITLENLAVLGLGELAHIGVGASVREGARVAVDSSEADGEELDSTIMMDVAMGSSVKNMLESQRMEAEADAIMDSMVTEQALESATNKRMLDQQNSQFFEGLFQGLWGSKPSEKSLDPSLTESLSEVDEKRRRKTRRRRKRPTSYTVDASAERPAPPIDSQPSPQTIAQANGLDKDHPYIQQNEAVTKANQKTAYEAYEAEEQHEKVWSLMQEREDTALAAEKSVKKRDDLQRDTSKMENDWTLFVENIDRLMAAGQAATSEKILGSAKTLVEKLKAQHAKQDEAIKQVHIDATAYRSKSNEVKKELSVESSEVDDTVNDAREALEKINRMKQLSTFVRVPLNDEEENDQAQRIH